jgi:hypothetical protein
MLKEMKEGRGPIYMDTVSALAKLRETLTPKSEAPRSRGLGRLPRHVHRPVRYLGRREHRAGEEELRADADRALPAGFPLRLLRHLGLGSDRRRRPDRGRHAEKDKIPGHLPSGWNWGYRSMTTVKGLFTAGDGVGASGHKFSSGSHAEGRLCRQGHGQVRAGQQGSEAGARHRRRHPGGRDLPAGAHLPGAQGLHHGDRRQPALHHAQDAAVPSAEDHGRVRGRCRDLLHHQRAHAEGGGREARDAEGRRREDACQGPARTAAGLGELPPHPDRRSPHEAHPVP